MAADNDDDKSSGSKVRKGLLTEKQRGTSDDFEVLKMILDENPALKQRVLNKIKSVRKSNKA